jgi:hypothetical protein
MNYARIYNSLINRATARILEGYYEVHHVIPICCGGTDEESNLLNLTPEEHYVAHQLLVKMHPNNRKLINAAQMMIPNRPTNKMYGWLRRKHSKAQSEFVSGKNNPNSGNMWIYNLTARECKLVPVGETLLDGWERGRVINFDAFIEKQESSARWKIKQHNAKLTRIRQKHHAIRSDVEFRTAKAKREFVRFVDSGLSLMQYAKMTKQTAMKLSNWFNQFIPEYKVTARKNANKQLEKV